MPKRMNRKILHRSEDRAKQSQPDEWIMDIARDSEINLTAESEIITGETKIWKTSGNGKRHKSSIQCVISYHLP